MSLVVVIGLVALAGVAALACFVARESSQGVVHALWLAVTFAFAASLGFGVFSIAQVHYVMPAGWFLALVAKAIAVVGPFVRIGMDVRWRPSRVAPSSGSLSSPLCASVRSR